MLILGVNFVTSHNDLHSKKIFQTMVWGGGGTLVVSIGRPDNPKTQSLRPWPSPVQIQFEHNRAIIRTPHWRPLCPI